MVDKLGNLYDEVRGFRHDFAGIVASMEPAIANQDMAEVSTIYQDVFLKTNEKLRKADYTAFNLHNIHDIAIRNTLAKAMIVADKQGIHFSLETVGDCRRTGIAYVGGYPYPLYPHDKCLRGSQ